MKPLTKHPKQQRMEDMTFPIMLPARAFFNGVKKTSDMYCRHNVVKSLVCARCVKEYSKDKITWEGREWLRSINDPNHERHVAVVVLLVASIIYCVAVILWK